MLQSYQICLYTLVRLKPRNVLSQGYQDHKRLKKLDFMPEKGTTRIEAFNNGVFAVATILLILVSVSPYFYGRTKPRHLPIINAGDKHVYGITGTTDRSGPAAG